MYKRLSILTVLLITSSFVSVQLDLELSSEDLVSYCEVNSDPTTVLPTIAFDLIGDFSIRLAGVKAAFARAESCPSEIFGYPCGEGYSRLCGQEWIVNCDATVQTSLACPPDGGYCGGS